MSDLTNSLTITFATEQERKDFKRAAEACGRTEEDLATKLCMDFARKFDYMQNEITPLEAMRHCERIYDNSDLPWSERYDKIFELYGSRISPHVNIEWVDPDMDYQDDVVAFMAALTPVRERMEKEEYEKWEKNQSPLNLEQ